MALTDKLTSIANAIREKGGTTDKLTLDAMPNAIAALSTGGGSGDDSDVKFAWEGDLTYWNRYGNWDWYFTRYGDKITTSNITGITESFYDSKIKEIPFDFNGKDGTKYSASKMFNGCEFVTEIGDLNGMTFTGITDMFNGCSNLRYLPNFNNCVFTNLHTSSTSQIGFIQQTASLRNIPEELLKEIYSTKTSSYASFYRNTFMGCYVLDEVRGLNPNSNTFTSNVFVNTFYSCYRLKNIIFSINDDGSVYDVNWKSQTIDLSSGVGYTDSPSLIMNYNSGITADKEVYDAATYAALKDDPDWWSSDYNYSRFNHDSAVNLINSLPDASAYLATQSGATNTIKFKTGSGSATDGGSVSNLTEEEIAVAAAKGWTISYTG